MKTKLTCLLLVLTCIVSCKKDQHLVAPKSTSSISDPSKTLSLEEVKEWYNAHVPAASNLQARATGKTFFLSSLSISWNKLESLYNTKGNYWIVSLVGQPTFQNVKQGYRKLAFIRDTSGIIQARILEIIPDVLYIQRRQEASTADFTGRIFIYDETYCLLGGQVLADGKMIGKIVPSIAHTSTKLPIIRTDKYQDIIIYVLII